MARPLPKTNAPAFTKNRNRAPRVLSAAVPYAPVVSVLRLGNANEADAGRLSLGGARSSMAITPHARNNQTISDCLHAVVIVITRNTAHRTRSRPIVARINFTA